jgi:hypothetical protein
MADLTQEQLEEMVVGKNPNPRAIFFEQAVLNVEESHRLGHRYYETKVYIKLSQPGVTDSVSYAATPDDIAQYRDEYAYYMQNRQGQRAPGIEIIPNLDLAHLQELRDYGIINIPQLAEVSEIPQHLTYARDAAKVFNMALQEISHAEEEGNNTQTETENVPASDRQQHGHEIGRPIIPASDSSHGRGSTSEGNGQGGRAHGGQGINDWNISFTL